MNEKNFGIWFSEAKNDFEIADILLNSQKFNGAVFHFCQAAEKAVKSLLYYIGFKPWGHSIFNLLKKYEEESHQVSNNLKILGKKLEKHYLISRYPDRSPNIAPKDVYDKIKAIEIKDETQKIIDFVKKEMGDLF